MSAMQAVRTPFVQNTDAWLAARREGLGSSDIPIVVGEREGYTTLWAVKAGLMEPEPPDEALQALFDIGHALEPVLRKLYKAKTGRTAISVTNMLRHPAEPWMLASLDGRAGKRVVELKWSNSARWYSDERVPGDVLAQIQWQLHVSGLDVADIAVLKGRDFDVIEVPRDQVYIDDMVFVARDFWHHVQTKTRPTMDGSEDTRKALQRLHPRDTEPLMLPTADVDLMARQLAQARGEARDPTNQEESLKNAFRALLGDAAGVENKAEGYRITWTKNRDSVKTETNWEAVARAYRLLLDEAHDVVPSRVDEVAEQAGVRVLDWDQFLGALESIHTTEVHKEGARVLRLSGALFKDAPAPVTHAE